MGRKKQGAFDDLVDMAARLSSRFQTNQGERA